MSRNMQKIISAAKELFFPKKCLFCAAYGDFLCGDCQSLLDISPTHRPDKTKKYLSDIYSPCPYENKRVKKIIHNCKYEPFSRELARPMAEIIAGHFSLCGKNTAGFILVPVPLAPKRLRQRGFNQALILAQELARIWKIPLAADCLIKIRETKRQAELSQEERLENLREAFLAADKEIFKNKRVLLLDDVATTGATMEECAKTLRRANAIEVVGVCFARTEG